MIEMFSVKNYRSVKNIDLHLGSLNIVFGPNGSGKSNLYNSLRLINAAANGNLSSALASEGGIQKAMWAGDNNLSEPKRIKLSIDTNEFSYDIEIGYPIKLPYPTFFKLDPIIKEENLWLPGFTKRPSSSLMKRKNQTVFLTDVNSNSVSYPSTLYENESVFGQMGEPHLYPEISKAREFIKNWRFYHEFNISNSSPLRFPQVGYRSPVLSSDGLNLAAAFQTINEIGDEMLLRQVLRTAFPKCSFDIVITNGRFQIQMYRDGLKRPLEATEMSDGTLRFLCLAVALLSPRPPAFIVLNEPENSLHRDMLPALATLIAEASRYSQIILTSHSPELSDLIKGHRDFNLFELNIAHGETHVTQIL